MKKTLLIALISLALSACSHTPSFDDGQSNTKISGKAVMYSQRTF